MQKLNFTSRFESKALLSSRIITMFSLSKEKSLLRVLSKFIWKVISISTGKTKVAPRLRRFNKFMTLLFKYNKNHGSAFTIKWLKACHLAVQRKLSNQPCKTLRDIDPSIPLPRLINGLPTFIGTMDRKMIRNHHPGTIRLWLSILSIYRILSGPLNIKLNTITDKFQGSKDEIINISSELKVLLPHWKMIENLPKISSSKIVRSLSAGPNNPVALHSVITDAIAIAKYPEIYEPFRKYCLLTKSSLIKELDLIINLSYTLLEKYGNDWVRKSKGISFDDIALGKLSFKEEAAGKLRIFAIADIWTQSLFKPLHEALFAFLKRLPNDGTFDQDASFERCLEKAQLNGCAFSVDLSSATDRLPITLQSEILNLIFKIPGLGECWKSILIDRPYMIRKNKYGIVDPYVYYETGQPMGALSSWAMLATTHHLLLQVCAKRAYPSLKGWYSHYEILGDDLVIFDHSVYLQYISMMSLLDVGTNPSKSLYSESLSSFEFAKRTGTEGQDVSGLSFKQFISDTSLSGRINLLIHFGKKGLVRTIPMILTILGKAKGDISILGLLRENSKTRPLMENSLMALLGYFVNCNKISLRDAVAFTIDPHDEDLENLDNPSLPIIATLHESLRLLNLKEVPSPFQPEHLSDYKDRLDIARTEVIGYMADSIVRDSLSKSLLLMNNYDLLLDLYATKLVEPGLKLASSEQKGDSPFSLRKEFNCNHPFSSVELAQLRSISEMVLLDNQDPEDLKDQVYDFLMEQRELPTMKDALKFSTLVDNFESSLKSDSNSRAIHKGQFGWLHKDIISAGQLKVTPYWKLLA